MNSLEQLNDHSRTSVTVTDQRPAGVIFDRSKPTIDFDFVAEITYDGFPYYIEFDMVSIEEIPNWETAQCYYQVEVFSDEPDLINDTGIFFDIVQGGVTQQPPLAVTVQDNTDQLPLPNAVIKVEYFKTKQEWIEFGQGNFQWIQPSINQLNTALLYFARVSLNWTDVETNSQQRIRWEIYDPEFYYDINMESEFTLIGNFNQTKSIVSNMISSFAFTSGSTGRKEAFANLVSTSTFVALSQNIALVAVFNLTSGSVVTTNITNMGDRQYDGNTSNKLFDPNTFDNPVVDNPDPTAAITIALFSPDGEFGTSTSASTTYSFTGTTAQINANWGNIVFYPNKDVSANISFTYTQSVGAVTLINRAFSLFNRGMGGAQSEKTYNFLFSQTWFPTVEERKYSRMSFAISAGGGGGAANSTWDRDNVERGLVSYLSGGGGGSAGQLVLLTNQDILNSSYNITIGQGGQGAPFGNNFGDNAGDSIFNNVVAKGGRGGRSFPGIVPTKTGADSNYIGGFSGGFGPSEGQSGPFKGGGGAGTGGPGFDNGQGGGVSQQYFIRPNQALFGGQGGRGGTTFSVGDTTEFGSGGNGAQVSTGNSPGNINPNPSRPGINGRVRIVTHP